DRGLQVILIASPMGSHSPSVMGCATTRPPRRIYSHTASVSHSLPPSQNLPPDQPHRSPDQNIRHGGDQPQLPPLLLRDVIGAEIDRPGRRAVMGQPGGEV